MSSPSPTEKLPLAVTQAYGLVFEALTKIHEKAHYLPHLERDAACSFVKICKNANQMQNEAADLGYPRANLTNVIHLTESWNLKLKKTLSAEAMKKVFGNSAKPPKGRCDMISALRDNDRKIFLSEGRNMNLQSVAHELVHWLDHPNWGLIFSGEKDLNEGATEALMRRLAKGDSKDSIYADLKNTVYNGEVDDLMEHMVTEGKDEEIDEKTKGPNSKFTTEDLMSAYFDGNTEALKKVAKAYKNDKAVEKIDKMIADEGKKAG